MCCAWGIYHRDVCARSASQPSRGCWGTRGTGRGFREACKMRMRSSCRAWAAGVSSGTRLAVLPSALPGGAASAACTLGDDGVGDGAARLRTATTAGPSVPATPKPGGIDDAEGAARAAASAPQSIGSAEPPSATEATLEAPARTPSTAGRAIPLVSGRAPSNNAPRPRK